AYASGAEESPLGELPIQYADFAVWQREFLRGERLKAELAYWHAQLQGAPSTLALPFDRPRERAPKLQRGATYHFTVAPELTAAARALSQREGVTLFMTLLASFQTLLHVYTSQDDFLLGADVANRNRVETEGLIGFFVNMLVLRADLTGDPSFRDLLRRVRETTLDAYAHQDVPFEKLVEELQPERDLSRNPLFQVVFVLQNTPMPALELPGLTLEPVELHNPVAKFDLILSLREQGGGLDGTFMYSADLFDDATVARMAEHFTTLLAGVVADPDQSLSRLRLLGDEYTGGYTPADFPEAGLSQRDFEALLMKLSDMPEA
ncbi:MAG TPA: condensation domain-containing protein, partial [Pyrinomonadaceae bacterium]